MAGSASAREPRAVRGARALLFDRLVDEHPESAEEAQSLRVLGRDALRESVRRELARLLNTRSPRPEAFTSGEELTVLDYGVPDFSHLTAASPDDRRNLADILAKAIAAFEPRLRQVQVILEQPPGGETRLVGHIHAMLEVGTVKEPISFPLAFGTVTGEAAILAPA